MKSLFAVTLLLVVTVAYAAMCHGKVTHPFEIGRLAFDFVLALTTRSAVALCACSRIPRLSPTATRCTPARPSS